MSVFAADTLVKLQIRPIEAKLLALALDPAARGSEITTAAQKLISCLRARGVSTSDVFRSGSKPKPASFRTESSELARAKTTRMTFGRHRGKLLRDVPLSYLRWARDN